MKIIIVGGQGLIGKYLVSHFSRENEIISAGRNNADITVDLENYSSINSMFDQVQNVDAVICVAGEAKWLPFAELTEDDYYVGIKSKLMGQVNLTRAAINKINKGGAVILTTGILADHPVPMTSSAAMVNGAIHSFVQATSKDNTNGVRVCAVSCGLVQDAAEKYKDYFPGHKIISMEKMASAYYRCLHGDQHGHIEKVYS